MYKPIPSTQAQSPVHRLSSARQRSAPHIDNSPSSSLASVPQSARRTPHHGVSSGFFDPSNDPAWFTPHLHQASSSTLPFAIETLLPAPCAHYPDDEMVHDEAMIEDGFIETSGMGYGAPADEAFESSRRYSEGDQPLAASGTSDRQQFVEVRSSNLSRPSDDEPGLTAMLLIALVRQLAGRQRVLPVWLHPGADPYLPSRPLEHVLRHRLVERHLTRHASLRTGLDAGRLRPATASDRVRAVCRRRDGGLAGGVLGRGGRRPSPQSEPLVGFGFPAALADLARSLAVHRRARPARDVQAATTPRSALGLGFAPANTGSLGSVISPSFARSRQHSGSARVRQP